MKLRVLASGDADGRFSLLALLVDGHPASGDVLVDEEMGAQYEVEARRPIRGPAGERRAVVLVKPLDGDTLPEEGATLTA
ncbi:MAG: hypothetical protein ACPGQD_05650 [Planctomycetota bacterium]